MQIAVTFRHMEPNEALKDYVREKVERIEKHLGNPQEVHVVLSHEKFRYSAEITAVSDGAPLNSQGKDTDLYAAIDQMADKMERQARERRGKERRKRPAGTAGAGAEAEGPAASDASADRAAVIERRRLVVEPMSVEEAAAQLDVLEQDFLLFLSPESGQINAVARKKGGGYDWIEPLLK